MDVVIFIFAVFSMVIAMVTVAVTPFGDASSTEWFFKWMVTLIVGLLANIILGISVILSKMERK